MERQIKHMVYQHTCLYNAPNFPHYQRMLLNISRLKKKSDINKIDGVGLEIGLPLFIFEGSKIKRTDPDIVDWILTINVCQQSVKSSQMVFQAERSIQI